MARAQRRNKRPQATYTLLSIRVTDYTARVGAAVNLNVYSPEYALIWDEEDPVYKLTTDVTITGLCTYPDDRAGDIYELTAYGNDAPSRELNVTLKDVQARDAHGSPRYRKCRGREIPVYDPPQRWRRPHREGQGRASLDGVGVRPLAFRP